MVDTSEIIVLPRPSLVGGHVGHRRDVIFTARYKPFRQVGSFLVRQEFLFEGKSAGRQNFTLSIGDEDDGNLGKGDEV